MAELIREWRDDEESRLVKGRLYEGVSLGDLPQLRDEATQWVLKRELNHLEKERIARVMQTLDVPSDPHTIIRLQENPLITIRVNRSGLTREQIGPSGLRVACLFYEWNQMQSGGARVTMDRFLYKGFPQVLEVGLN